MHSEPTEGATTAYLAAVLDTGLDLELVYLEAAFGEDALDELVTRIALGENPHEAIRTFRHEMDELDQFFDLPDADVIPLHSETPQRRATEEQRAA